MCCVSSFHVIYCIKLNLGIAYKLFIWSKLLCNQCCIHRSITHYFRRALRNRLFSHFCYRKTYPITHSLKAFFIHILSEIDDTFNPFNTMFSATYIIDLIYSRAYLKLYLFCIFFYYLKMKSWVILMCTKNLNN